MEMWKEKGEVAAGGRSSLKLHNTLICISWEKKAKDRAAEKGKVFPAHPVVFPMPPEAPQSHYHLPAMLAL